MPQVRLQISSKNGPLLDEQVDSAIVMKYRQLVARGLDDGEVIRALWAEDFDDEPAIATLSGVTTDGLPINIKVRSRLV